MENLKNLNTQLEILNSLSEQLLRKSLPIMKKMGDKKEFLSDIIQKKYPSFVEKDVKLPQFCFCKLLNNYYLIIIKIFNIL